MGGEMRYNNDFSSDPADPRGCAVRTLPKGLLLLLSSVLQNLPMSSLRNLKKTNSQIRTTDRWIDISIFPFQMHSFNF